MSIEPGLNIRFKIHYHWFLILLTIPYLLWEIYWAQKVGYTCIKWHSRLMVYLYLWIAVYLLLHYTLGKFSSHIYPIALTVASSVIVSMAIAELFLSVFRVNETFIERIGYGYNSPFHAEGESWYHTYTPNKDHWITKREYSYKRPANSLGFSDIAWPLKKKRKEKRILCIGDSFTEGDGAPYDSSYVSQLRNKFTGDSSVFVMNAGTCGSDPFINFMNYRERLWVYQPDLIVQTLSSGDVSVDLAVRGGMERFLPHGKVKFKNGPWWEPVYAVSFLSRLYFNARGYNELLLRNEDIEAQKKELDSIVIDLFKRYAEQAQKNNCRLLVVLQPFLFEVNAQKYTYDFSEILAAFKGTANLQVLDLIPYYESYLNKEHSSVSNFYWKGDGHHNSTGYRMMADGIYAGIIKENLLLNRTNNLE